MPLTPHPFAAKWKRSNLSEMSAYQRVVARHPDYAKKLRERTLTNLYNERPAWLASAHRVLDEAVFAAYGWPVEVSDEELLAKLLALNLSRAG